MAVDDRVFWVVLEDEAYPVLFIVSAAALLKESRQWNTNVRGLLAPLESEEMVAWRVRIMFQMGQPAYQLTLTPQIDTPISIDPIPSAFDRLQELGAQHCTRFNILTTTARELSPERPSLDHLHIFVQRLPRDHPYLHASDTPTCFAPPRRPVICRPAVFRTPSWLLGPSIETRIVCGNSRLDNFVNDELDSTRPFIEAFILNLFKLEPSTCANGPRPSFLFHNGDHKVQNIFERYTNIFICNTPGSGKIRWMLEGLTAHWGFYFSTTPGPGHIGVTDLSHTMDLIRQHPEWKTDLSSVPLEQRRCQHWKNHKIAMYHLMKLLIARMLVFEVFLQETIWLDRKLEDKHCRFWLLFQLFEGWPGAAVPAGQTQHPFLRILESLQQLSQEDLGLLISRMSHIRSTYLAPNSRFIIGLDEAHHAVQLFPSSFLSLPDETVYRSMLDKIITTFDEEARPSKLVVLGTGLSRHDVEDWNRWAIGVSQRIPDTVAVIHPLSSENGDSSEELWSSLHYQGYEQTHGSTLQSEGRLDGEGDGEGDALMGECSTGEAGGRPAPGPNFPLSEAFDRVLRL